MIKGLRLKLLWGRPQAPKPESEVPDEARQQAAVTHSGLLPRALISQQQNQPFQPPGTQDQPPAMPYFNIPPMPQQDRPYYPSMDPQRMGALVQSQEGTSSSATGSGPGENKSGSENQQGQVMHIHMGHHLKVNFTRLIIHPMGICNHLLHLINSIFLNLIKLQHPNHLVVSNPHICSRLSQQQQPHNSLNLCSFVRHLQSGRSM